MRCCVVAASVDDAIMAGGVVAVIAVNVVSFGYVYYAYVIEDLDGAEDEGAGTSGAAEAKKDK